MMTALETRIQDEWNARGWVRLVALLPKSTVARLPSWVDAISNEPEGDEGRRLHYYEQTDHGPVMCRTERYIDDHRGLRDLITTPPLVDVAACLLGEAAVLYKEKVNYKHPGGAGFAPHQDAMAYRFAQNHVTCLVAVDAMSEDNGCLEFARGTFESILPDNGDGCLDDDTAGQLNWEPVPVPPGGVIFFSSLVPHRSGPNRGVHSRRALYLTYNGRSAGDLREAYYEARAKEMRNAPGRGASRISNIGHFQGRPISEERES